MGEKPVGGLIAIIAVALLSVITFGLIVTNQSNREPQVVEVTVSTSEEVVNGSENGSNNQNSSSIGVAQSADESGDDDNEVDEPVDKTKKNTGNFQNRGQQNESNAPAQNSETENDEEEAPVNNDGDEEEEESSPSDQENNNNTPQEFVTENNSSEEFVENNDEKPSNQGANQRNSIQSNNSAQPNSNDDDEPIISIITNEELDKDDLPGCWKSSEYGPREDCSSIKVTAECDAGTVVFTITNQEGDNTSMKYASTWRLYHSGEDEPFETDTFQLTGTPPNNQLVITYDGGGEVRLEADQLAYHPGKSRPNAVHKCSDPDSEPDPQEFICDSLYYVNHINDNDTTNSPLFRVNFADGVANLTYLNNFDFDQVHISASLDGKWMYGVSEDGDGIQRLDLDLTDGDQSEAPNGHLVVDEFDKRIKNITQVAFSPYDKLYIGSAGTNKLYVATNIAESKFQTLGKITKSDLSGTIDIGGGDIAFDENGELYLMTRADNTIYHIDLIGMIGTPVTRPGKSTGLAIDNKGAGNFVYSDTGDNTVVLLNRNAPYDELGRYKMKLDGKKFSAVWGDMSAGCMERLPDPIIDLEIEKESVAEGIDINTVLVGQSFDYTLKVWNNGNATATGVYVTDELPSEVELTDESSIMTTQGTCEYIVNTRTVECVLGGLEHGEENAVMIRFTVKAVKVVAEDELVNNVAVVTSYEDKDQDDDNIDIDEPPPPTNACKADLGVKYYENYTYEDLNNQRRQGFKVKGLPTPEEGNNGGYNFASLGVDDDNDGFGGRIDLYFDGAIYPVDGNDFYVYETSWGHLYNPSCDVYPETVIAEILYKGVWYPINGQSTCRTGGFDFSGMMTADNQPILYAEAIRLIDTTHPSYATDGDGFDVDGVLCAEPPKPNPNPDPTPDLTDYMCEPTLIHEYAPGKTKNGGNIPYNRSDEPYENGIALTIENNDTYNFISLGYGNDKPFNDEEKTGRIIYDFGEDNVIMNVVGEDDFVVVETSWGDTNRDWEKYKEQADVYASQDLVNWVYLGTDRKDMTFDLGELDWARYIMLVDTTPDNSNSGDGFDIDGLGARECGEAPQPPEPASCLAFKATAYEPTNPENIADDRDNPGEAESVNPADFDKPPVNFVSLGGADGYIVLEPTDGAIYIDANPTLYIWETTYGEGTQHKTCDSYKELAYVEVSPDGGQTWYTVPSVGGGDMICRDGAVDLAAAGALHGFDYVTAIRITDGGSSTPDGYDVDGLSCVPYKPEPVEPEYETCEMLFYSHNADEINKSVLYTVYLNDETGIAEMYLLDDETGFGDSHIAASANGKLLYLIENKEPYRLGVYNVETGNMDVIGETDIRGVTQAAVHPHTGVLYVASSNTNTVYTVDTSTASATTLGQVKINGEVVNINGADIAFGSDGTFYLSTRATNKIYKVDLNTMTIVETVASKAEMNGMTIEELGRGDFVYASRSKNAFVRTDGTTSTSFNAVAYEESFDIEWGDMASCIAYDEPEEPEDPPLEPPAQCDALFNHVKNPSFEEPVVVHNNNWDVYTSDNLPGWNVEWTMPAVACGGEAEPVLELQNTGLNLATPVDGNQYAELDSDCGGPSNREGGEVTTIVSQLIKTKPGKTYTFEFYARARRGSMDFTAMFGDVNVFNATGNKTTLDTNWEHFSFEFVATDTTTKISFSDLGVADSFGVFLDAVGVFEKCEDENPTPPDGQICIKLDQFATGQSIEGPGVLHSDMSLTTAAGNTVAMRDGETPTTYGAPNGNASRTSGCLVDGFGDNTAQANRLHDYVFEFADGKIVKDFSLSMFDFGDYNPARATSHTIKLVGYDADGNAVAEDVLTYDSSNATNPKTSSVGNLYVTGDACTGDADGSIGVYDFNIANTEGIKTVKVLYENNGTNSYGGDRPSDPNIAFGEICFDLADAPPPPPPPPPPPTVCEAGTGLGIAAQFNVFVFGDFNSNSDTEGRMAIGGNATLDGYGIGFMLDNEWDYQDTLIVGGDLTVNNGGQIYHGNSVVGGTDHTDETFNLLKGDKLSGTPIDFDAAETELKALSASYASYAANGTATLMYGSNLVLVGTHPDLNIFDVNGADINTASNFTIDVPEGSLVIVNVSGQSVTMQYMGVPNQGNNPVALNPAHVLYNFHEATELILNGVGPNGSMLAPYAAVSFDNGQLNGTLVAASFDGSGQLNHRPYEGCIEEPEVEPIIDLELTKTAVSSTVHVGDEFSFELVGYNNGPEVAGIFMDEGTIITDYLPDNAEFVSASWIKGSMTGTCTEAGGVLTCDVGTLEVMETVTATVKFVATELGTVENTGRIDPAIPEDSDPSNNQDDDSVDVVDACEFGGDPEAHLRSSIKAFVPEGWETNYNQDGTSQWKGTVTNSSENCSYEVGMASYEKHNGGALNLQVLSDSDPVEPIEGWDTGDLPEDDPTRIIVEPGETIMLFVTAPACATQLDLFYDASHLGVYDNYDQADADLPPLVLPQFQTNDWGSYGNTYGPRLLAAKHINNDNDCAGPILTCEEMQVSIPDGWMTTEYSTDNSTWITVDGTIDVAPVYIKSTFTSNPKRVEYWMDGQKLHTENGSPYYAMGNNNAWTPANSGDLLIWAYHSTENCYVEQVIPVQAPQQKQLVQAPSAYVCPMTVMIGDQIVTDNGNITHHLTEAVTVTSTFSEGTSVSKVRYYVDGDHVDDENSAPYIFLGDNNQLTLSQAEGWAGEDGEFLLFVAAEKDGEVCSSVNIKVTLNEVEEPGSFGEEDTEE